MLTTLLAVGAGIQYNAQTGRVSGNLLYAEFGGDFLFHTTVFYEVQCATLHGSNVRPHGGTARNFAQNEHHAMFEVAG